MDSDTSDFSWASPPGDTIRDLLRERALSHEQLCEGLEVDAQTLRHLLAGRDNLTDQVAKKLESVFGTPSSFWINRERDYRRALARISTARARTDVAWSRELPVRQMMDWGWLPLSKDATRAERAAACLTFFGAESVDDWKEMHDNLLPGVSFKASKTIKPKFGSIAAWLRQGEIEARGMASGPWNRERLLSEVPALRLLTRKHDPAVFLPELQRKCGECGVAIVLLRAPTGCPVSGATRRLDDGKALLMLSARHLTDDHLWFAVFHEIGHLVLHGDQGVILETQEEETSQREIEADEFAANTLIPPEHGVRLETISLDVKSILRFARTVGVSPGIVVGQLQHRKRLRPDQMNRLKRRFTWDRSPY